MKKKTIEEKPERKRRSNAELLPMPRDKMKAIRALAALSRMPEQQVYDDVLDLGLCEAERVLYKGMIEARTEIQNRRKETTSHEHEPVNRGSNGETSAPEPDRSGSSDSDVWDKSDFEGSVSPPELSEHDITQGEGADNSGLDNAVVGSGLDTQDSASLRLADQTD